jgi:hypothetical protein
MTMSRTNPKTDQMPLITVVTSVVTAAIGTTVMILTVYSGLFTNEVLQVQLSIFFLALLPVGGWIFRSKRRSSS